MPAQTLLQIIGHAVLDAVGGSVFDDFVIEASPHLAEQVWQAWQHASPTALAKREDLEALVWVFGEETEGQAESVVRQLTLASPEMREGLLNYLRLVPSALRRRCRRPAQPAGTAIPDNLSLTGAADVLALLPARVTLFHPGERLGNLGDWEMQDLLDAPSFGEIWKAINPRQPSAPAAVMHFLAFPAAKEYIIREEARLLDQVLMHAKHPGIVPLQKVFMDVDPPCVQYAHVDATPLPSLVEQWRETGWKIDPLVVAGLVQQIAQAMGYLHRMQPPVVLRHLRPSNVLVQAKGANEWTCWLARVGLGPWSGLTLPRDDATLYVSQEQQAGQPPLPRDDVFALGVLWYQLLSGNLVSGRPGGSHWRRKLGDLGMNQALIELLETCFEDDPSYRPVDGVELATRLAETLKPVETKTPRPEAEVEALSRRARRPDIKQLFDSLEKTAPPKPKLITNSIDLKLVLIPAGQFLMGSPAAEPGRRVCEGPTHEVTITKDFYLGVVPVTQRQFEEVMGKNPAFFKLAQGGDRDHPVECVTWEEAAAFCQQLSQRPEEKGRRYRLPTEAEWEYACRAGTSTLFAFGNALGDGQANFDCSFPHDGPRGFPMQKTSKVGLFPASHFGLHDMHGNVWEWCGDWLGADFYRKSPKRDPRGPELGDFRVLRGGSWRNQALTCRSAYRNGLAPNLRDKYTGFRVVLEA